jgi:phosphoglucomutase
MSSAEKANEWLQSPVVDEATKTEVRKLLEPGNEKELEDAFYTGLEFGTGGLRGIMGAGTNRMNRYTVGMATQGLANYLREVCPDEKIKVAIAHDCRNNSRFFAETAASVFSANDIEVHLFEELRPTPELSFAIRHLGCQSGVVITASHNPREYNGFKAYWADGAQLLAPHDKNVIGHVQKISGFELVRFEGKPALVHFIGPALDEAYMTYLESIRVNASHELDQNVRIVFSSIHGTGITMVPPMLQRIGYRQISVVEAQATPDGNFPTVVYPNPEEHEAMTMALNLAGQVDADLVMATDPDADRVGIAVKSEDGTFELLNGNQTGSLLVYYMLENLKQKGFSGNEYIAKTIVTSNLIRDIGNAYGLPCYETLTGFKYIAALIREKEGKEKYLFGAEESYGYMIGDGVRDKDAVSACILLADMAAWLKKQGKTVKQALIELYERHGFYKEALASLTLKGLDGSQKIQEMMANLRSDPPALLDGVEVVQVLDYQIGKSRNLSTGVTSELHFPTSNVLQFILQDGSTISARPSGTEPKIKFYFSVKGHLLAASGYTVKDKELSEKLDRLKWELTKDYL